MIRLGVKQRKLALWWHDDDDDGVIAVGAVRSGKTLSMIAGFILWSQSMFKNQNFILAGRTVGSLTRNVVYPMLMLLNEVFNFPYSYNRSIGFIRIGTNTYWLFGANSEQSQDAIQGMTAAGALLDEVLLMPRSFVDQSMARCSVEGAKFWWSCNPGDPNHYVKKEFIDAAAEKHIKVFKFGMNDNPQLSEEVKQRYRRMYTGVFYQRFINGEWVAAEGLVYQGVDLAKVVKTPKFDDRKLPHFVSIDYGITNPFVAIDWVIKDGVAYAVDEYCFNSREENYRRTDEEHYQAISKWLKGKYVEDIIIDPSANSFKECIRRHDEFSFRNAENAVLDGISTTSSALSAGCVFISPKCKRTIEEFSMYCWDKKAKGEQVVKENDHAMDALRYFIMTEGVNSLECFQWD